MAILVARPSRGGFLSLIVGTSRQASTSASRRRASIPGRTASISAANSSSVIRSSAGIGGYVTAKVRLAKSPLAVRWGMPFRRTGAQRKARRSSASV